jgi:hypothetical protein
MHVIGLMEVIGVVLCMLSGECNRTGWEGTDHHFSFDTNAFDASINKIGRPQHCEKKSAVSAM